MRHSTCLAACLLLLGAGCQPSENQEVTLKIANPTELLRTDEAVIIPVSQLREKGMTSDAGTWVPHTADGAIVPFQYDDLDGDGKDDELVLLAHVEANGTQSITFKPLVSKANIAARTHLRLGKKTDAGLEPVTEAKRLTTWINSETYTMFQFEGVGWENEHVAFRNYLDMRNGMDIFGKTKPQLVLDRVDTEEDGPYHEMRDWGLDILKVGSSLGAGSVAFWYQDSLIRLTSEDADYQVVKEGPIRSIFNLNFRGVNLGDKQIDVVHTVSIYAGTYGYEATLTLSDETGVQVVPGIVDLHELSSQSFSNETSEVLYTYGFQSENKDSLGMALLVSQQLMPKAVDTDTLNGKIPNSYGLVLNPAGAAYRFYAGWELSSPLFKNEAAFEAYLAEEMQRFGTLSFELE